MITLKKIARGQRRRAWYVDMAENIPNERASYDAAATTPGLQFPQQLRADHVIQAF